MNLPLKFIWTSCFQKHLMITIWCWGPFSYLSHSLTESQINSLFIARKFEWYLKFYVKLLVFHRFLKARKFDIDKSKAYGGWHVTVEEGFGADTTMQVKADRIQDIHLAHASAGLNTRNKVYIHSDSLPCLIINYR